jgi:hypothetical protein
MRQDLSDYPILNGENGANREGKMPSARPNMRSEGWDANGMSFLFDEQDEDLDAASFIAASFDRSTTPANGDISAQVGLKWQPCMPAIEYSLQPWR